MNGPHIPTVNADALRQALLIFERNHRLALGERDDIGFSDDPDLLAYEALEEVTEDEGEREALMARTMAMRHLFTDPRMQPFLRQTAEGAMVHRQVLVVASEASLNDREEFDADAFFFAVGEP